MKKLVYSIYFKLAAALLCVACAVCSARTISSCFIRMADENEVVYEFEKEPKDSNHLNFLLDMPQRAVDYAYDTFYSNIDTDTADKSGLYALIEDRLAEVDKNVDYYVIADGNTFTNCFANGNEYFSGKKYYTISEKKAGAIYFITTAGNTSDKSRTSINSNVPSEVSITVCSALRDSYADGYDALWNSQANMVKRTFYSALIFLIAAILAIIYLTCVCGRDENNRVKSAWIDNIFTELHFLIIGFSLFGGFGLGVIMVGGNVESNFPEFMAVPLTLLTTAAAISLALTSYLALIREIKHGKFIKNSFTYRFIRMCIRLAKKIFNKIKKLFSAISGFRGSKTSTILISMLLVFTVAAMICGALFPHSWFFAAVLFIAAAFLTDRRAKDTEQIKNGTKEIRNGNISYKIPELKCTDLQETAENINEIGTGLNQSLESRLRAERMKTELITNVSHDLKTPLTSIISYTKLLSDMDNLPQEANDYIKIISKKSERLKNLTQDLFDISKVQSGNDDIKKEKIDASILISQSIGEHDSEIKASGFEFVVNVPKELYITADGRKMSRVIGNLLQNILKYSQKGTRVFISAYGQRDKIIMEFKNISSYPMDFDAEDITERFVRGDKSRSIDGNGLGLAIAKSYVEACGGIFKIKIDGDMFKSVIEFDKI